MMREFKHPNMDNFECPICHTSTDAPVVLVGIPGTEEGNIMQAEQVHSECYILYSKMHGINVSNRYNNFYQVQTDLNEFVFPKGAVDLHLDFDDNRIVLNDRSTIMTYNCKYCNNEMQVKFLEYKENHFCNDCFDERVRSSDVSEQDRNKSIFMGVVIEGD